MLPNGICYTISNATTYYAYPGLTCTEGQALPNFTNRQRDTYIKDENGYFIQSQSTTISNTIGTTYSVAHLWDESWQEKIDLNSLVLPATLIILALFSIILKMFMGVKR
jgi:hypothetical protein